MSEKRTYSRLSWEPEILISLGFVFALFQTPSWIAEIKVYLEPFRYLLKNEILVFLSIGLGILTLGFILHLFIKSLWIAMNALNYSIGNELHSKITFVSKNTSLDIEHHADRINQLAGLTFGISLYLLYSFLGIVSYGVFISVIINILGISESSLIFYLLLSALLLFIFDSVSGGILKNGRLAKLYYPIYLAVSTITLSFLYRPMYYSIFSGKEKLKVYSIILILLVIGSPLAYINFSKALNLGSILREKYTFYETRTSPELSRWNGYYLEKYSEDDFIIFAAVEKVYIEKDILELYLRYKDVERVFEGTSSDGLSDSVFQVLVNDKIDILIDQKAVKGLWRFHKLKRTNQLTMMNSIEVRDLLKGWHVLNISIPEIDRELNIEFYKE